MQAFTRFNIYHNIKLLHIDIPKNASTSQKYLAWEPENWASASVPPIEDQDLGRGEYYQDHKTPELAREFYSEFYSSYNKSLFIRNPTDRFGSALCQDYFELKRRDFHQQDTKMNLQEWTNTSEFIDDFEAMLLDLSQDPSWEKLQFYLKYGQYNEFTLDFHLRFQTECVNFECLPADIVYFDVDKNITANYRHWLFENNMTKNKAGLLEDPDNSHTYHLNNSSVADQSRKHFKKLVASYMSDPNSPMHAWVKHYYEADLEMYNRSKPSCYTLGQESQP